ncbi:MAG: carboxylating nicotinate-nucleotide diphosphorylase [Chloroflexi bacterium]|nr:carboxylating nicotinate-nucleotide diphosphorylase [Chloroflexota bacterium]
MLLIRETFDLIDRALAEDQVAHDVTTDTLITSGQQGAVVLVARAEGVLAGLPVAGAVFARVDPSLRLEALAEDGSPVSPGQHLARIEGAVAGMLRAERTALNFLQRMSGVATETARYVRAVEGLPARVLDTRKTLPGHRHLDKYAVRMGGGRNHRHNLSDGILIKDNHIAAARAQGLSLADTVRNAVERAPMALKVEVEVESQEEALEALDAGAHILLLDNMTPDDMRQIVGMAKGRALTEASGGIDLETVRAVAETGVDFISSGALTHSTRALDISMELQA